MNTWLGCCHKPGGGVGDLCDIQSDTFQHTKWSGQRSRMDSSHSWELRNRREVLITVTGALLRFILPNVGPLNVPFYTFQHSFYFGSKTLQKSQVLYLSKTNQSYAKLIFRGNFTTSYLLVDFRQLEISCDCQKKVRQTLACKDMYTGG